MQGLCCEKDSWQTFRVVSEMFLRVFISLHRHSKSQLAVFRCWYRNRHSHTHRWDELKPTRGGGLWAYLHDALVPIAVPFLHCVLHRLPTHTLKDTWHQVTSISKWNQNCPYLLLWYMFLVLLSNINHHTCKKFWLRKNGSDNERMTQKHYKSNISNRYCRSYEIFM